MKCDRNANRRQTKQVKTKGLTKLSSHTEFSHNAPVFKRSSSVRLIDLLIEIAKSSMMMMMIQLESVYIESVWRKLGWQACRRLSFLSHFISLTLDFHAFCHLMSLLNKIQRQHENWTTIKIRCKCWSRHIIIDFYVNIYQLWLLFLVNDLVWVSLISAEASMSERL